MRGIYLVGQYPDRDTFKKCLNSICDAGYEFVEVGIPFSEPVADGPVIAGAIQKALEGGANAESILEDIKNADTKGADVYIMTYSNIIYAGGIKDFSDKFSPYIKGVIVPDVPNRMHGFFYDRGFEIPMIPFVTPESRDEDIKLVAETKGDFIYFIGIRGITGSSANLESPELKERIEKLREITGKKIVMGFGIKDKEGADSALRLADGFVVGTAAVTKQKDVAEYTKFIKGLI